MRQRVVRHPLGGGFDAQRAYHALIAGRSDSVWLDSGDGGVSYLALGRPIEVRGFAGLVDALASMAPDGMLEGEPEASGFRLGLVGWLGYELRGETTGAAVTRASRYPDASLLRIDRCLAIDGRTGEAELLALAPDADDDGWSGELGEWRENTVRILEAEGLSPDTTPVPPDTPSVRRDPSAPRAHRHDDDARYLEMIDACQAAIREGEAYQLCLTTEIEVTFDDDDQSDPGELYRILRSSSPTHHGAVLRIGDVSLVSVSPERFLEITPDQEISTSPIKGTRPRGADAASDASTAAELLASEKELAENLMIVDLMRNDLSRVCDPSSIEVTRLQEVESYAQVHQLVSTVRGRLREGVSPIDAIAACFPAGSMTGAPKRRATEILDGLERRARGIYAGAFGYLGLDGRVDLAMVIRSVVLDARGATIGAGGGITALSDPAEELAEMKLKAAPLLAALGAPPL